MGTTETNANRHNDGDAVDELDAAVVKHRQLEFPRMNDLTATGSFRPHFSSGLRFVVDQELRCWNTCWYRGQAPSAEWLVAIVLYVCEGNVREAMLSLILRQRIERGS